MAATERFSNLPDYAFPRLRKLLSGLAPGGPRIALSLGEPRHGMPAFVGEVLQQNVAGFERYPVNEGAPELLDAITAWLKRRFDLAMEPENIMVLNGSREGLFNATMALGQDRKAGSQALVVHPNPFYPCYRAAALAIGAEPVALNATAANGYLPDYTSLSSAQLDRVTVAFLCTPSNPQGRIASHGYIAELLRLAEKHDFFVFSDECYSEIWRDTAPMSALQVAAEIGVNPDRVLAFHSLSKRSNMPGLRSGFVAGGVNSIKSLRKLRSYSGAPVPPPLQSVSARIWADEAHVAESRAQYLRKYDMADQALMAHSGYQSPEAGFFLWLPVSDGEAATQALWQNHGIEALPGAYLATGESANNPGRGYLRVALVAEEDVLEPALHTLAQTLTAFQRET